jgi:hypothetical protein
MSKKLKKAIASGARRSHVERRRSLRNSLGARRYQNLFVEGREYVFDGNRVTAHWRVGRNDVGRWRLETIKPDLSFVITADLRIRKYPKKVRLIRPFETVFDALKPLDQAICHCAEHGHLWSLVQTTATCANGQYVWTWCLSCGAEQSSFPESGESLQWPEDAAKIAERTAGALPTLHGPVVGGTPCNR